MSAARRILVMGLLLILCYSAAAAPAVARNGVGVDITRTAMGKGRIKATAASFAAQGDAVSEQDLTATELDDGGILVLRKGYEAKKTVDGFRVTTPRDGAASDKATGSLAVAAGGSWSLLGSQCYGALWRGAAHMDACHKRYKMASDGDATKDYWRLDLYATMFAEGRTLDWGWVTGDRDAGPALSFVDWSPDADVWQNCATFGLSISVAGVGGGFSSTFCELNNISKSAGATVGWFKDYWDWNSGLPVRDRDRKVAILIGASSAQGTGTPTWGLSWNFAAH